MPLLPNIDSQVEGLVRRLRKDLCLILLGVDIEHGSSPGDARTRPALAHQVLGREARSRGCGLAKHIPEVLYLGFKRLLSIYATSPNHLRGVGLHVYIRGLRFPAQARDFLGASLSRIIPNICSKIKGLY